MKTSSLTPKVLFEDKAILVLEKPAGIVVNRAKTVKDKTLQDWVERKKTLRDKDIKILRESDFIRRSGIIHRLDKETSGVMVVAKNPQVFNNLQKQFKERKVEKKYLALVHGEVSPPKGKITASISRSPFDRKKFGVFLGGRPAKTKYKVKKHYALYSKPYTLLELVPTTGRTHQIRVHLKYIGYPVVSDSKYAGRKTARADRKWCSRQFLHASFLSFFHPKKNKKVKFSSPLPVELQNALEKMVK